MAGSGQVASGAIRRLFSVSMPRAGHHVMEMTLGRLLGPRFYYCEFYSIPGCCHTIPCTRTAEYAKAGATVFMQKSHDHALTDDPAAAFDGIVVQVREPVARALSNYELDLETLKLAHSETYRRYWLGIEAAYTLGFVAKWCTPAANRLLLRYEDLLTDPVAYFRSLFVHFALNPAAFDEAKLRDQLQTQAAGGGRKFRVRDIRASTYFDAADLGTFQHLLRTAVAGLGYAPHDLPAPRGRKEGAMQLAFQAKRSIFAGNNAEAVALLDRYAALPDADPASRLLRGAVLHSLGQLDRAQADFLAYLDQRKADARGYRNLAQLHLQRGNIAALREVVERGMKLSAAPDILRDWVIAQEHRPELRELAQAVAAAREIAREDVIEGFRMLLGRDPENDMVILQHQRIEGWQELRKMLIGSDEFREKHAAALLGDPPHETPALDAELSDAEVATAFRWLLGRQPENEATIAIHRAHRTLGRLRLVLMRSPEFRRKMDGAA